MQREREVGHVELPEAALEHRFCLLTTRTRISDRAHTAELWFVPAPGGAYLMSSSGGLTSWFLNLQTEEEAVLRIGSTAWQVRAAFPGRDAPERADALAAFSSRYDSTQGTDRLGAWEHDAVVAHLVLVRELR
jgi:hypothetical protein